MTIGNVATAYSCGIVARSFGETKQDNPFKPGTDNHFGWFAGWMAADKAFKQAAKS